MKKTIAVLSVLAVLLPASAFGMPRVTKTKTDTNKSRYVEGEIVTVVFTNESETTVTIGDTWRIVDSRDGQEQSQYVWPEEERTVEPGEERVWNWEQNQGCYGICQNIKYGEPSGPGKYHVEIPWSEGDGPIILPFEIGQYFTIGFSYDDDMKFIVYSNRPEAVDQMEEEAAAQEKTKLVLGTVRTRRTYNPDWKFSLASGSIEIAEVAIEVCDGNPRYVQRHRDEWRGETWCPWSSYVEKVGR